MDNKFLADMKEKHPKVFDLFLNYWGIAHSYEIKGMTWLEEIITGKVIYGFFDSHGVYGYVHMEEDGRWFWEIRECNDDDTYTGGGGGAWEHQNRDGAELALFSILFDILEKR